MGAVQQCSASAEGSPRGSGANTNNGTGAPISGTPRDSAGAIDDGDVLWCGGNSAASSCCVKGKILACDFPQVRHPVAEPSASETCAKGALPPVSDFRCQTGELHCKDGAVYRGQLLDGRRHGQGTQTSASEHFAGQWREDARHGNGRHTWHGLRGCAKRIYEGQYQDGLLHGHGRMEWHTSSGLMVYEGQYAEDKKHGAGRYDWPDGRVYDGQWRRGQRWGRAVFTSSVGLTKKGVWQEDHVVYWLGEQRSAEAGCPVEDEEEVQVPSKPLAM